MHTDEEVHEWFEGVVHSSREVWVAASYDGPVALLVLDGEWIDQLYVDPAFARRGVGGRLLDCAKERRPEGLKLWTFQANARARRFYRGHGFVVVDSTGGVNEEGAPDACYRWRPASAGSGLA